jgi:ATP-dependent Clp protease ATP-binding subunit ClpA
MIESLIDGVRRTQQIEVGLADTARADLRSLCLTDLSNGGRGIRNQLEAHFVNPLSRLLFDADAKPGAQIEIDSIERGSTTTLKSTVSGGQA